MMKKRINSAMSSFFCCKITLSATVLFFSISLCLFSQKYNLEQEKGFDAFRKGDWISAILFLRKAVSSDIGFNDETLYLLIMSEINSGDYSSGLDDCNLFLEKFNSSKYASYIHFYRGKALHFLGRNEEAVLVLSDFCHQNQNSELYASALYWIAECFYAEYNFDSSRALYERIIYDFPDDSKASDARYRVEMIAQREREEKLLYLLKVTSEENLATREDYERQLKIFKTQDNLGLKKSLSDAQLKIKELEEELLSKNEENTRLLEENKNLVSQNTALQNEKDAFISESKIKSQNDKDVTNEKSPSVYNPSYPSVIADPAVEALKKKASYLQYLLDEQKSNKR